MPRNNKNWSLADEKRLLELIASGASTALIAKTLQRTEAAVQGRAHTLKHRSDPRLRSKDAGDQQTE
jgi:hypothetical protein